VRRIGPAIWWASLSLLLLLIALAIHSHWYDGDIGWRRWHTVPQTSRTCFFIAVGWGEGDLYFSQARLAENLPAASFQFGDFARSEPDGFFLRAAPSIPHETYRERKRSPWVQDVVYRMQWVERTGPAQIDSHRWDRPGSTMYFTHVILPLWVPIAIFGVMHAVGFVVIVFRHRRTRRRRSAGRCEKCGYDVRATPGDCPECGFANPPPQDYRNSLA
jgi:hypothetical protein